MITKTDAQKLYIGQEIYNAFHFNADKSFQRWRVNGKCKTWKTKPEEFVVPIKHGLWTYDYLNHENAFDFCLSEEEAEQVFQENRQEQAMQSLRLKPDLWSRKPLTVEEVNTSISLREYSPFTDIIPVFTSMELFGWDENDEANTEVIIDEEFVNDMPDVFLWHRYDNRMFLVRTESYPYTRYMCEVKRSEA